MFTSRTLKRQMESLLVLYSFFRKSKHAKTKSRDQSKMLEKNVFLTLSIEKKTKALSDEKEKKKLFVQKYKFLWWLKKEILRIF